MPRIARYVETGRPHHVILRGNNRRKLFSYVSEYLLFIAYLRRALRRHHCQLHAMCLMTNHVHLLITPMRDQALSKCVKMFAQLYAQTRNKRRNGSGRLFEKRFRSHPITSNEHIAIVTAYIDLNAQAAGMTSVDDYWPWSTYAIHAGRKGRARISSEVWSPTAWYLNLGTNAGDRAAVYRSFVHEYFQRRVEVLSVQQSEEADRMAVLAAYKRIERPDRTRAA